MWGREVSGGPMSWTRLSHLRGSGLTPGRSFKTLSATRLSGHPGHYCSRSPGGAVGLPLTVQHLEPHVCRKTRAASTSATACRSHFSFHLIGLVSPAAHWWPSRTAPSAAGPPGSGISLATRSDRGAGRVPTPLLSLYMQHRSLFDFSSSWFYVYLVPFLHLRGGFVFQEKKKEETHSPFCLWSLFFLIFPTSKYSFVICKYFLRFS